MSRRSRTLAGATATVLAVAALAAPSASAGPQAAGWAAKTTTVRVTATEFSFKLSKKTVRRGKVIFKVVNKGNIAHDFRIAGKKTKLLKPGKHAKLTVRFKKRGKYTYVCTVPGHAAAGMKGKLRVK